MVRYFEGCITPEEEKKLFGWLQESKDNELAFRRMEEEWRSNHSLQAEAAEVLRAVRRRERNRRFLRWSVTASSAAALILLGVFIFSLRKDVSVSREPLYYSMEAPLGTHSRISLPDGSIVWINAGSTLSYSSSFGISDRNIRLTGEAYFDVAKNPELPFRVEAGSCLFTVKGTKFDIQAYEDDSEVTAVLMQGSLQCEADERCEMLIPGDRVIIGDNGYFLKDRTNADQYRSWVDGTICYDMISFPVLIRRLSREYNVPIRLETDRFNERTLHVSFSQSDDIATILNSVAAIIPMQLTSNGKSYIIK